MQMVAFILFFCINTIYATEEEIAQAQTTIHTMEEKLNKLNIALQRLSVDQKLDFADHSTVEADIKRTRLYIKQYKKKIAEKQNLVTFLKEKKAKEDAKALEEKEKAQKELEKKEKEKKDKKTQRKTNKQTKPAKKNNDPTVPRPLNTPKTMFPTKKLEIIKKTPTTDKKNQKQEISKTTSKTCKPLEPEQPSYTTSLVKGHILKPFNVTKKNLPDPMHQKSGIVINCSPNTTVFAPVDAQVILIQKLYAHTLCIIKHHEHYFTAIFGMNSIFVSEGDYITAGKPIGRVPDTKPSLLYLELRKNDTPINPAHWLV